MLKGKESEGMQVDFKTLTTEEQYKLIANECKEEYCEKRAKYGDSLSMYRALTFTDQIKIKLKRLYAKEEGVKFKVEEPIEDCYKAIFNYSIVAVTKLEGRGTDVAAYITTMDECRRLMLRKNNDYGEAWRDMYLVSLTDIMLAKISRLQYMILDEKDNKSIVDCFQDIANYSIFAMIKLGLAK